MLEDAIYLFQIAVLLACIYMTYQSRRALNGLTRSVILFIVLLIARRLNDAFGILDSVAVLILSSIVVLIIAADLSYIYRQRHFYEAWHKARGEREAQLERMRKHSEQLNARRNWDDEAVKRWL